MVKEIKNSLRHGGAVPPPSWREAIRGECVAVGKYQDWITEEGILKISAWARRGLSNEQIAENIGVSRKTFQEWLKKFDVLKDAVKNSKEVADIHVENALFKKCLGYTVTVKKNMKIRTEGGIEEIVPVEEEVYVSPDVNAQKFWLQHRKAEDWGKAVEELIREEDGGVVEIPGITPSVNDRVPEKQSFLGGGETVEKERLEYLESRTDKNEFRRDSSLLNPSTTQSVVPLPLGKGGGTGALGIGDSDE